MNVKVEKLPKFQLKISVSVENDRVTDTYNKILEKAVSETEVDGFRKGKAPKEKVIQKIGAQKLYADTIDELLQVFYPQALKENLISPISNPKVEIKEFDLKKDFEFVAEVATKPDIKMGDYKKALKTYYEEKRKQIKKINEEKLKKGEKIEHDHMHLHPNEIIEALVNSLVVEVPEILIEEETTRMMSRLVDEIVAAGMKVDDYLKSQKVTIETVKQNYNKAAEKNIKAEFAMSETIKLEKISVSEQEIDNAISEVENKETREQLSTPLQRIYIRSILEKNKLINKLTKEIEGENNHE